jgi:hypothetical protein
MFITTWRASVIAGLLLATACAGQPGLSAKKGVTHAPRPPADYVFIGSGDLSKPKNVDVVIDFDSPSGEPLILPAIFGMGFMAAVHEGAAPAPQHSGQGDSTTDPIKFPTVTDDDELDAAGDYMAATYPGYEAAAGHLFRAPDKRYLMWVEFKTDASPGALYFDVSRWVAARKAHMAG